MMIMIKVWMNIIIGADLYKLVPGQSTRERDADGVEGDREWGGVSHSPAV